MNDLVNNPFFTPLENTMPYIKMAAEGSAGTGKTHTLALIAIGLHKRITSTKPIIIFDTEQSAKFLKQMFADAEIEVFVKPSKTLPDLAKTIEMCNDGAADILLIDSITHVWENFLSDYNNNGNRRLQFQDWAKIKPTWKREFSQRFVDAQCHVLFTGREGYTYDYEMVNGRRELIKTGVKMKAEGETAYEADVILRMERFEEILDRDNKKVWRECTIVKGRGDKLIDAKTFVNPTYADFAPFVEFVLTNPVKKTETLSHPNSDLIEHEEKIIDDRRETAIVAERNQALLNEVAAGSSGDAKATRLALTKLAYHGETSDTAISLMSKAEHQEANERLGPIVAVIKRLQQAETFVYPVTKAVTAARLEHLETANLGEATIEQLISYMDHVAEKYKAEKKLDGNDA